MENERASVSDALRWTEIRQQCGGAAVAGL